MKCTIVILGITGDLSKKKLIPAIYRLIKDKKINEFSIIGVGRKDLAIAEIIYGSKEYIGKADDSILKKLISHSHYFKADFDDEKRMSELGSCIDSIEKRQDSRGNRIFYLATLPEHFESITRSIKPFAKDSKVVFEKPFGTDLESAKRLNRCILSVFKEKQIYRIDHYLGKELVQGIAILRYSNIIFEPIWNNKYVDNIQIIVSEDFGVEDRIGYYDKYGAIKDVFQNHLLQMTALVAMEMPKFLKGEYIRDEKIKVLKKIRPVRAIRGQYLGYPIKSGTETCAAAELRIDNPRWKNVPFFLLTGKEFSQRIALINIEFKLPECSMFEKLCVVEPNHLSIDIQPKSGFHFHINTKLPGELKIDRVKMDYCHSCAYPNSPEAYENLLHDAIIGDQSLFVRSDEIEEQWRITDSLPDSRLFKYKQKTLPDEIKSFAKNRHWHL